MSYMSRPFVSIKAVWYYYNGCSELTSEGPLFVCIRMSSSRLAPPSLLVCLPVLCLATVARAVYQASTCMITLMLLSCCTLLLSLSSHSLHARGALNDSDGQSTDGWMDGCCVAQRVLRARMRDAGAAVTLVRQPTSQQLEQYSRSEVQHVCTAASTLASGT